MTPAEADISAGVSIRAVRVTEGRANNLSTVGNIDDRHGKIKARSWVFFMSMQAINYALTLPIDDPGPRLTLIMIAFHVNYRSGDMFVGQDDLASEVRVTPRSIRRYLETLEEAGFIKREERRVDGRQGTDRITLIGYLEWQHVIEHGGTIQNPLSRGKPVHNLEDKLSASPPPGGQPGSSSRTENGLQADTAVRSKEPTNQKLTTSARKGACEAGASPLRAQVGAKPLRLFQTVRRGDVSWTDWIEKLTAAGHRDLAETIATAGSLIATSRWYSPEGSLPKAGKATGLSSASKRMSGEVAS